MKFHIKLVRYRVTEKLQHRVLATYLIWKVWYLGILKVLNWTELFFFRGEEGSSRAWYRALSQIFPAVLWNKPYFHSFQRPPMFMLKSTASGMVRVHVQHMPQWKGPMGIYKSNSWLHTGLPKMPLSSLHHHNFLALLQIFGSVARTFPRRFVLPLNVNSDTPVGKNLNPLSYTSAKAVKDSDGKVCAKGLHNSCTAVVICS